MHVIYYITSEKAWESSLVAGRHEFTQVYKDTSSQPSPKWQLLGTRLALVRYLFYLLDKDQSFKIKKPIARNVFFLVPCIIFMRISRPAYARHDYFKDIFSEYQGKFSVIVLVRMFSSYSVSKNFSIEPGGKQRISWHKTVLYRRPNKKIL